jgi:hypothetical protein
MPTAENRRECEHGARGFQKVVAEKGYEYAIFGSDCGSALLASEGHQQKRLSGQDPDLFVSPWINRIAPGCLRGGCPKKEAGMSTHFR